MAFGREASTYNRASIAFNYNGSGSSLNNIAFGFFGTTITPLQVLASTRVAVASSSSPIGQFQIGSDNGNQDPGALFPQVRIVGNQVNAIQQSMLRFVRPTNNSNFYASTAEFRMNTYGTGGVGDNYAPKTELSLYLKNDSFYKDDANKRVITFRDDGNVTINGNLWIAGNLTSTGYKNASGSSGITGTFYYVNMSGGNCTQTFSQGLLMSAVDCGP